MTITREYVWDADDVRNFCIRHNYYTHGDCEAYGKMLNMVRREKYSDELLYKVAEDIFKHSCDDEETITNIMFKLFQETIMVVFEVE